MGCRNGCKDEDNGCVNSNARCAQYNTALPEWSSIEECPNIEETTKEIYTEISEIRARLDLTCDKINYIKELNGKVTVANGIKGIEDALCELLNKSDATPTSFLDVDISREGFDFACLHDACNHPITTLRGFIEAAILKLCI